MAPQTDSDEGAESSDEQSSSAASTTETEPSGACTLKESSSNPAVTLTGSLCGEAVSITTRAGSVIHLGRSAATDPETEVRVIEVLESEDPSAASNLEDAQFLVNLAFETGPEIASTLGEYSLVSGVFSLCGFGTVVFQQAPVTFEISDVVDGAVNGDITITLTDLLVAGFSPNHGQSKVAGCGGALDLTLTGRFVHQ